MTTLNAYGTLLYSLPTPTRHSFTITICDQYQDTEPATCVVNAETQGAALAKAVEVYSTEFYGHTVNLDPQFIHDAVTVIFHPDGGVNPVGFFASDPQPIRLQRIGDPVPLSA